LISLAFLLDYFVFCNWFCIYIYI